MDFKITPLLNLNSLNSNTSLALLAVVFNYVWACLRFLRAVSGVCLRWHFIYNPCCYIHVLCLMMQQDDKRLQSSAAEQNLPTGTQTNKTTGN